MHDAEQVERGHAHGRLGEIVVEDLEQLGAQERRRRSASARSRATVIQNAWHETGTGEVGEDHTLARTEHSVRCALAAGGARPPEARSPVGFSKVTARLSCCATATLDSTSLTRCRRAATRVAATRSRPGGPTPST